MAMTAGTTTIARTDGSPSPAPTVLEYQDGASPAAGERTRRRLRTASLVALLPGLVVPFVPFACDARPAEMVREAVVGIFTGSTGGGSIGGALLCLPMFLVFPLFVWRLLGVLGQPARAGMRALLAVSGAVGGLCVATCLVMIVVEQPESLSPAEAAVVAGAGLILGTALGVALRLAVRLGDPDKAVAAAVAGPYAATLVFCIVVYSTGAQIGWYLAMLPALAALCELAAATITSLRRPTTSRLETPTAFSN